MMQMKQRHGNRWTVNEMLQLQREYELLNLSIDEIAYKHKRTPEAIKYKIQHTDFSYYFPLPHWNQTRPR